MKKFILMIGFILSITLLSACASTQVNTTRHPNYSTINGWGSSIDPVKSQGSRGGYSNSVFYY